MFCSWKLAQNTSTVLANFCGGKKQPLKLTATNMKVCFKVSIYTVSIMSKLTKVQREICSLISSWGYNVAPHKEIPYIWVFCGYSAHKEFSTYSTSLGVTLNMNLADVVFVAYCVLLCIYHNSSYQWPCGLLWNNCNRWRQREESEHRLWAFQTNQHITLLVW